MGEMVGSEFKPGDDRTIFMDTYAMQAKWHMWKYGTTQEQIAVGAAKNHNYGALNDKAQYRFQMTPQSVMEDRPVSYPLTRAMCAPIGDGAAAALLCSAEYLEKLPAAVKERAIKIAGVGFSGGKYRSLDEPGLTRAASDKAYKMAGLGPQDIDVAEVHDATSFCEIYQCEMLRFCPEGEGGKFVEFGRDRSRTASCRSTPRAAWSPRAIRSAPPASRCWPNSRCSCAARPARARSRAPRSPWPRTAAA